MKIRTKTLLAIGGSVVFFTAFMFWVMSSYVVRRFEVLEQTQTIADIERGTQALSGEVDRLNETVGDYAGWDDSYKFVIDHNKDFITSNMTNTEFVALKLNLVVFTDPNGKIVFSKFFDWRSRVESPLPKDFESLILNPASPYAFTTSTAGLRGVVNFPDGPYLIAAQPILTSQRQGPIHGTLIMGRKLDREYITLLSTRTRISLDFQPFTKDVPVGLFSSQTLTSSTVPIAVQTLNKQQIEGLAIIPDVYKQPGLILRLVQARNIFQSGVESSDFVLFSSLGLGIILMIIVYLLTERLFLTPILQLTESVHAFKEKGTVPEALVVHGHDEFTELASMVQETFGDLDRSKRRLTESTVRFEKLADAALEGVIISENKRIIDVNKSALQMFGYSHEDIVGTPIEKILTPETAPFIIKHIQEELNDSYEARALRKDGSTFDVIITGRTISVGGKKTRISVIRDISEQKRTEETLKQNEERYRMLVESSRDFVTVVDPNGTITYINPACKELGYTVEDLVGKNIFSFVHPEDVGMMQGRMRAIMETPNTEHAPAEFRFQHRNGTWHRLEALGQNMLRFTDSPGIYVYAHDVTDRYTIQDILQKSKDRAVAERERLDAIVHSIGGGVFVVDVTRSVILVNKATETLSGYTADEMMGEPSEQHLQFVNEGRGDGVIEIVNTVMESGKSQEWAEKVSIRQNNGNLVPVFVSGAPIRNAEGKVAGCVVVFHDMTREREIERMKSEFVSIAAHQLRTPLTAIKWELELLMEGGMKGFKPMQRETLGDISASSERLIQLVADLLNVSRIESGKKFSIVKKQVDLASIAKDAIADLHVLADDKKLKLVLDAKKALCITMVDPDKMKQVFMNIVGNAVKYTPAGGTITITAESGPGEVIFHISDTGIGIPKAQQSKIYDKFFRADNAQAVDINGTGLGLYIAKAIIDAHDGKIWFESKENKGTTFSFSVPCEAVEKTAKKTKETKLSPVGRKKGV